MTLPERFETIRADHHEGETFVMRQVQGRVCLGCLQEHPCSTSQALDALDMALEFIEHVAYDVWSSGDLLIEAKAVIDQIGGGE